MEKTCFSGRQSCSTSLARTFRQAWAVWFNSLLITDIIYYIEYRIAQIFQLEVIFYLCAVSDSPRRTQSCSGSTDRSSDCVCVCVCVCVYVCLSVCLCVCVLITDNHRAQAGRLCSRQLWAGVCLQLASLGRLPVHDVAAVAPQHLSPPHHRSSCSSS